ncbi:hypothetical protein [Sulfitobacter aestuariivivens]|uniref:Uncharacterized protein n=1 Tax=Sulfitobacter aestuariivivens TaxID=2766981 RepID=A0A927D7W8_9RHOB|nr:hypothetical protein [Sulfitobacter aestuariivivens]MBD3666051.1 hypothetical protein [Sulfitobacter aestuariivivens]
MMQSQDIQMPKTITVTPASEVHAELPQTGVLRFERKRGAMAGNPAMGFDEDGNVAFYFADGASVYLACA